MQWSEYVEPGRLQKPDNSSRSKWVLHLRNIHTMPVLASSRIFIPSWSRKSVSIDTMPYDYLVCATISNAEFPRHSSIMK